jgi:hypothetical protein
MYSTLLIGHKKYPGEQRVCCWPFKGRQLQKSNRQDMVMVRPPGIDKGGFQLRIDNVWFCKVLFLFSFVSQNDQKRQQHDCAFVSVLEEYKGRRRPLGQVACICIPSIICIFYISCIYLPPGWIERVNSAMVYERKSNKQVLYVLPITSILSKLPLVPVGDTGTIPFSMRGEAADFDGGSCDSKPGEADGSRWWYVNSWAMSWSSRM